MIHKFRVGDTARIVTPDELREVLGTCEVSDDYMDFLAKHSGRLVRIAAIYDGSEQKNGAKRVFVTQFPDGAGLLLVGDRFEFYEDCLAPHSSRFKTNYAK